MDGQRFDDFARLIGTGLSRRRALKGILGGAVVAAAGNRLSASAQAVCKEQDEACDDSTNCCSDLSCLPAVDGNTCQAPESCLSNGAECDQNESCCSEFCDIANSVCADACGATGAECSADTDCCESLTCAQGSCLHCRPAGAACGGSEGGGCCPGASCVDGVGCVADSTGNATVTIHVATCPTGVGAAIFDQCHGNVQSGVSFGVDSANAAPNAFASVTITSDGGGAASTTVGTGSVTVTENSATFGAYLGAYVYCSEQNSGTVLLDTDAPGGTVTFSANDGDDIICDWYNITPAAAPAPEPTTPAAGGATTLPSTGIAESASAEHDSWLGVAALGGAAALLAAKQLRDRANRAG